MKKAEIKLIDDFFDIIFCKEKNCELCKGARRSYKRLLSKLKGGDK